MHLKRSQKERIEYQSIHVRHDTEKNLSNEQLDVLLKMESVIR